MVICLQLMPLPLTVSCFSKIQIGFTFLVLAHPGSRGLRSVKRVCVVQTGEFRESRVAMPWELLYADDMAVIAETEEELIKRLNDWKDNVESQGLRVVLDQQPLSRLFVCVLRSVRCASVTKQYNSIPA